MDKIIRNNTDPILKDIFENFEKWGKQWEEESKHPGAKFDWRREKSDRTLFNYRDKKVILSLIELTGNRCAFCGFFRLYDENHSRDHSKVTIEHFKSKRKYPREAYKWENLFPCCGVCNQGKDDLPAENLIKPDEEHYFPYDHFDGQSDGKLTYQNQKAKETIEAYNLNRGELIRRRREILKKLKKLILSKDDMHYINEESYKFFINFFFKDNNSVFEKETSLIDTLVNS